MAGLEDAGSPCFYLFVCSIKGLPNLYETFQKKLWQKISRLPYEIGDDNDEDGGGWKTRAHPAVVCLFAP